MKEYHQVWTLKSGPRFTAETGLSRYYGTGLGRPPETENSHYKELFSEHAGKGESWKQVEKKYLERKNLGLIVMKELDEFFIHDRCIRESGHDTTFRFMAKTGGIWKERCADFNSVDLNSLLYKYEVDFAVLIKEEFNNSFIYDGKKMDYQFWKNRADERKKLIKKFLYDPETGFYVDYNFKQKSRSSYIAATVFYPIWAWDSDYPEMQLFDSSTVERYVLQAVALLKEKGGIAATAKKSWKKFAGRRPRQWEYPNGWAPHQMIIWNGLSRFDKRFEKLVQELTYRWLYVLTYNAAQYNMTITEKYDVVRGSHDVFAEYGNVGRDFDYITREGFGWMNASYQIGLSYLDLNQRKSLDNLNRASLVFPDQEK